MASSLFLDKSNDQVYQYVRRKSDGKIGVYCLDYSDITNGNVAACATPFTVLAPASINTYYSQTGSSTSEDDGKIWAIDTYSGNLMCFDMDTESECPDDNGVSVGTAGGQYDGLTKARVTAIEGKVFFTVNNILGCYDPSTHDLCGDPNSTPVAIPNATVVGDVYNRHAPLPIYSTSGVFEGVCDINSQLCIGPDGESATMPTGLDAYFTANPSNHYIAGQNAQQWAISGTRMYYPGPGDPTNPYSANPHNWSSTLICWDYSLDTLCPGFAGDDDGIVLPYSANVDPDNPSCVWLNQDKGWAPQNIPGKIIPFDAETGEVGCALGDPVVELPYSSVVPRMSCLSEGRVTAWGEIELGLDGLSPSDITISIFDDEGVIVPGWEDLLPDSDGILDLSDLTVAESSTKPTIQMTGHGVITMEEMLDVVGTVTYEADDPEMCLSLEAATNCPDEAMNIPGPGVPAGIIEGASVTTPLGAGHDVGTNDRVTVAGTDSGSLCAASLPGDATTVPELAATGFDPGGLALGGFAALVAGLGAVALNRRRVG